MSNNYGNSQFIKQLVNDKVSLSQDYNRYRASKVI